MNPKEGRQDFRILFQGYVSALQTFGVYNINRRPKLPGLKPDKEALAIHVQREFIKVAANVHRLFWYLCGFDMEA